MGASLRAQYDAMGAAAPPIFLHERFNDAIDFDSEPPVYRSMTGSTGSSTMTDSLSWQSMCDDLDFDVEPAVYRSFAAAAMPDSRAAWMQSLPPLVQRQRVRSALSLTPLCSGESNSVRVPPPGVVPQHASVLRAQ